MACSRAVAAACCRSGRRDEGGVHVMGFGGATSSTLLHSCQPGNVRRIAEVRMHRPARGYREHNWRAVWGLRATAAAVGAVEEDVQKAKFRLLTSLLETGRGLSTTSEQRATIEEALVDVEKFGAGMPLELDKLDGSWLLQFTTAPDVVQILQASETPFLKVGQIFQKFECEGRTDGGVIRNVVRWSVPQILQDDDGATLVVTAKFSVVSSRTIALSFEEAELGQVAISEQFQGFLAPAALPRTFLTFQILQFFRSLKLRVPFTRPGNPADRNKRIPAGLCYYLTYLDNDMLLGRALGSGGVFIFRRTQTLHLSDVYKYYLQ